MEGKLNSKINDIDFIFQFSVKSRTLKSERFSERYGVILRLICFTSFVGWVLSALPVTTAGTRLCCLRFGREDTLLGGWLVHQYKMHSACQVRIIPVARPAFQCS